MERIIEERMREREKVINTVKDFAGKLDSIWDKVSVVIVGSYARGDFNEWSDIDVLIIVENEHPNPLKRYNKLVKLLVNPEYAKIEPIIITKKEFVKGLERKNPLIIEALEKGIVIKDKLGLFSRK